MTPSIAYCEYLVRVSQIKYIIKWLFHDGAAIKFSLVYFDVPFFYFRKNYDTGRFLIIECSFNSSNQCRIFLRYWCEFISIIGNNKHDNADKWCYYSWCKGCGLLFLYKKPPIKGGYEWVKNLSIDNWWVKFP